MILEPQELPSLEHEPPSAPGLDVIALLCEPPRSLRVRPELYSFVILPVRVLACSDSPEILHPLSLSLLKSQLSFFYYFFSFLSIDSMKTQRIDYSFNNSTLLLTLPLCVWHAITLGNFNLFVEVGLLLIIRDSPHKTFSTLNINKYMWREHKRSLNLFKF